MQVPGGSDGPSGLLVCSEGLITYHSLVDAPPVSIRIPQRVDAKSGGTLIVAHVMHKHKKLMFFIIQTEYGDLFKLTLDVDDDEVKQINLKSVLRTPFSLLSHFRLRGRAQRSTAGLGVLSERFPSSISVFAFLLDLRSHHGARRNARAN